MKAFIATLSLTRLVFAQTIFDDWHPPTDGDLRGPCPGLNALANHGILPRDGKNITIQTLVKALPAGVNVSAEISTILGVAALRTSSDPASGAFTLADLNKHNIIEHDGSLSRRDSYEVGNKQVFCQEIFDQFLGYFNGADQVSIPLAAAARWGRLETSRKSNPEFSYTATTRFNSYAETGVYFNVLQNPQTGKVPLDWLKILFQEERLPYKEGWRPLVPTHGGSISNIILNLALNTPEEPGDATPKREDLEAGFHQMILARM